MQFRDHPAVQGKRDFYPVDPRELKVDPGFNVRDLTTPDAIGKLTDLKESIIANGVRVPLEVRIDGDAIYVVSGHRRLAATLQAIKEGHDIKAVPCVPEPKGTNEIERTLNLIVANSGEPLQPLEQATVIKRLLDFGWTDAQVAQRIGWQTTQQVHNMLELLGAAPEVREMVRKGEVSATTAVAVSKKNGAKAGKVLKEAKKAAAQRGSDRVTSRDVEGSKRLKKGAVKAMIETLQQILQLGDSEPEASAMAEECLTEWELV